MDDFDFEDIEVDEFESIDLDGSKAGNNGQRGGMRTGMGGASSRVNGGYGVNAGGVSNGGYGMNTNGASGSGYDTNIGGAHGSGYGMNTSAISGNVHAAGYGADHRAGTGSAHDMHTYINDPGFDPTLDDDDFGFDDDFDMHGDVGYMDNPQTIGYASGSQTTGYSTRNGYTNQNGYTGRNGHTGSTGYPDEHDGAESYTGDTGRSGKAGSGAAGRSSDRRASAGVSKGSAGRGTSDSGRGSGKSRSTDGKTPKGGGSLMRRIIIFAIAEVLVLVGIFSYAFVKRQYNKIQRPDIDIEAVKNPNLSIEDIQKMDEGFWTIAIFGVDSRDNSAGKGNNSDVIIVANIDRQTGEIKLVSVFRDTYLSTGDGKYNKINAAYCNGGPELAIKALNENLDLNITQYVTFNWKAVATAVNMLGGVDVELSKAEFYYINSFITETVKGTGIASLHLTHAGMNHLDGVQAVAYARLRYMDNDYSRTERQRKIIGLCFDKVKKTDATTLANMAGVMLEMVATNMGWQEAGEAIGMMSKLYMGDTGGFPYARGEAVIGKRGSCVIPQTLESNVKELHRQLFHEEDYQCSERVKAIGAKISAESGMYNEGTFIGHVSTSGYIPETKPAQTSAAETSASETSESETIESSQSGLPDIEGMTDEELQMAIEAYLRKLGITSEEREYAVSDDGYIVYVAGQDADGLPTYKYVLGNDGKRIKIYESTQETTVSEAQSSTEAESTSQTAPTGPGGTTAATGPGATQSATESSAVETRAADTTGTSAAETSSPGSSTSGTISGTTASIRPGDTVSSSSTSQTTAVYPGSGSTDSSSGPGASSAAGTTAAVYPGSTTTAASTTAATTAATVETVPAAP